jgi:opacity protein-like surface antigen
MTKLSALWRGGIAALAMLAATVQATPVVVPQVTNSGGANVPSVATVPIGSDGTEKFTSGNPGVVTGGSSTTACGGVTCATSANQSTEITNLSTINTTLGSPMQAVPAASGKTPISGTFAATGSSTAFTPVAGKGIWVTLQGTWAGTVIAERSVDAGVTWLPLTVAGSSYGSFTANAEEVIAQEDEPGVATYRLRCTAYTSGTITYRLGHS